MIYNLDGLFGINMSIEQSLRTLMGNILALIYSLIDYLYTVFNYLSRAQILENDFIRSIYSKVGMILGIFMVFKLVFSLIQSLIDPNKFTDKKNGFASIIFRTIISIVLLGITPTIFKEAFKLQTLIIGANASSDNIIYKLIVGSSSTGNLDNMGRVIASDLYFTFYTDEDTPKLDEGVSDIYETSNPNCEGSACEYVSQDGKYFVDRFKDANFDTLKDDVVNKRKSFHDTVSYLVIKQESTDKYVIEFNWLLLLLVGCVVVWILVMYCIQVAIRVVQLAYLQLIAPVPILSYISDPEGTFKKWVNQCVATFLDVFFRMAIIYFVISLIGDVLTQFRRMGGVIFESTGIPSENSFTLGIVKIFIIVGLLLFAQKVPQLLQDLFPNLGKGAGKFSFGLNPKKEVFDPIKNLYNNTPLGWAPKALGWAGRKTIGAIDRKVHNVPKPRGKFGQYMDKLMPERAKDVAANRQAKIDDRLRLERDNRGKKIFDTCRTADENGELKFDPNKAFVGTGSSDYITSYNDLKRAKGDMKKAETLVNDIDKELTAAYAMAPGADRDAAIALAKNRREAAIKNYGAYEAKYNLAKEKHDSMKKMSKYKKFAEVEADYKFYTDRHPDFVTVPVASSEFDVGSEPIPVVDQTSSDQSVHDSPAVTRENSMFANMSDEEFNLRQSDNYDVQNTNPNDYFDALSDVISEDYLNNNGNLSEQYHNDFDQQWSRMEEAYTNAGWTKGADGKWSKSNASNNNNNTQNNTNNNQNS